MKKGTFQIVALLHQFAFIRLSGFVILTLSKLSRLESSSGLNSTALKSALQMLILVREWDYGFPGEIVYLIFAWIFLNQEYYLFLCKNSITRFIMSTKRYVNHIIKQQ
jgi:hypothetical protein